MTEALNNYLEQCDKDYERQGEEEEYERKYSTGWVCPVCGSVYAIWVAKCSLCGPETVTTTTSDWELS